MDLRRRGKVLLVLSMVLGCTTGYLVVKQQAQLREEMGTWTQVLVARKEITPYSTMTEDMLGTRAVPVRFLIPGMVRAEEKERLLRHVSSVKVEPNVLLTWSTMHEQTSRNPDHRTYTLTNSARVVFADLKPGDMVDVVAVYDKDKAGVAEVVASKVKVIAAWDEGRVSHVTLSVDPAAATNLAYYENYSRQLRLLRVG